MMKFPTEVLFAAIFAHRKAISLIAVAIDSTKIHAWDGCAAAIAPRRTAGI
jgi:hypothetical protein